MPGRDRIYTAGEKEHLYWEETRARGIPLNGALLGEMIAMRDELGLEGYDFESR
jgi:hypothetical protein